MSRIWKEPPAWTWFYSLGAQTSAVSTWGRT